MRTLVPCLLLLGLFAAASGQKPEDKPAETPKPRFTISKETTYVTEPVDKDGYIDYVTALNERLRKGVTPDNNAVVLLCQALGPRPEGKTMPAEFYEWLGIKEPPEKGEYYTETKKDDEESEHFNKQLDRAVKAPWAANECPLIAAWLKSNEKPLTLVVEATKRPRYFYPIVPEPRERGLMFIFLPGVQMNRAFANALIARAMFHLNEGRLDDAWNDLLACHRLGRLVGQGASVIEGLVGIALDTAAGYAVVRFSESPYVDTGRIRECLLDLQKLPPTPTMVDKMDINERFAFLETVLKFDRYGVGYLERLAGTGGQQFSFSNVLANMYWNNLDVDAVLREGNSWYDRVVAAMRGKDRSVRAKELVLIAEQLDKLRPRKARTKSKYLAVMLTQVAFPNAGKIQTAVERGEQQHQNLLLAFALAIHRREHGRYPAKLADLAPKYLAEVPADLFTGKPLVYRPSEKGYVLYSLGPNGKDDEGRNRDDEPAGDDLTVRMPLWQK